MSYSYNYLPMPPRVWSRVQNPCTYTDPSNNYTQAYIPLTNQTVSLAQANYEEKLLYKGNILQHKNNSARLTKSQKYTQLAKCMGPNRTKVFATQSQTYTNPNTTGLLRVNYNTFPFPNQLVGQPNNISGPFQYNVPNPFDCSSNVLQDGGNLVCGTYSNQCTGEIIKAGKTSAVICNPSYCSDVPGDPILLCWNTKVQTWFPKPRYVMNNSTDGWPEGYKGFVSAVTPIPPVLTLDIFTDTITTISWIIDSSNVCIPITSYKIYLNGQLYTTVSYQITSYTFYNLLCGNTINVTSISTNIESFFSNTVITYINPSTPVLTLDSSSNTTANISWTYDSECISGYNIYLNGQLYTKVSYQITSYTFYNLSCTNNINITSISIKNIETDFSNTITTNNSPLIPINLMFDSSSCSSATFSWTEQSTCATSYNIYKNGINISNVVGSTSYTADNLTLNTTYSFYVTSLFTTIESLPSNTISINIPSLGFDFTGSPSTKYSITQLTIDSITYQAITFRLGTFTFKSLCCTEIYQLFVVAGGANGVARNGGNGGEVKSYGNNIIGTEKIIVNTNNDFTLTVGEGGIFNGTTARNSTSVVTGVAQLNLTAIGGGGAAGGTTDGNDPPVLTPAGNGTLNIYTQLYYGGGGGSSGGSRRAGVNGGFGGGGGGGGSYAQGTTGTYNFTGGSGGGITGSGTDGGSGGLGGNLYGSTGQPGTTSIKGGGGGGGSWGSRLQGASGGSGGLGGGNGGGGGYQILGNGGSGGGGGGGSYYGGGGGGGGQGGGSGEAEGFGGNGAAGTIILIYR